MGNSQLFHIGINQFPYTVFQKLQKGNPFDLKIICNFKINSNIKVKPDEIKNTIFDYLKIYKNEFLKNDWFTLTDKQINGLIKCLKEQFF
tara:strand:- start:235 stop:504 length:270 start_codon:yes stop_codon:yes gene_type:complete